ncbi:hypothetical protein K435DRAFT_836229 [Dendrothele bispora CBS 962.96]|uniref:Deoxyribonuclease NucA/NucB domain-containing protein n=1 Tax=Dendrothele bispora (strain CBS 962.96) TaxID=1314807 RepID=A0A4S8MJU0_DENBC|nr:hypothetical protein K435DRAFT_836229 [Dendrothele bispora CBS 962.96]
MVNTGRLQVLPALIYLITVVSGATITFDCNNIPETCNNMCFAADRGVYFEMHFDPNTSNRDGRRQAAGCLPNPNRCQNNPPTASRITCDEYPFASTHGTGNGGWYSNTGATTRCVSRAECNSQGGSLSAFYQSFGRVDQTPVDVVVSDFAVAPYCQNAGMAPDGDFQTGIQPPNRRDSIIDGFGTGVAPPNKRADNVTVYEYKTAANRTVRSLTGPIDIGTEIFVPNPDWQNNSKVKRMLMRRQGDDDDCTGSRVQVEAASLLEKQELGETDKIVERL